jgi:hypothetical protein
MNVGQSCDVARHAELPLREDKCRTIEVIKNERRKRRKQLVGDAAGQQDPG